MEEINATLIFVLLEQKGFKLSEISNQYFAELPCEILVQYPFNQEVIVMLHKTKNNYFFPSFFFAFLSVFKQVSHACGVWHRILQQNTEKAWIYIQPRKKKKP